MQGEVKRTGEKRLEKLAGIINDLTRNPVRTWVVEPGAGKPKYVAQVGNYHLDHNDAGWRLQQVVGDRGGIVEVSPRLTKGQMEVWLRAFLKGLQYWGSWPCG